MGSLGQDPLRPGPALLPFGLTFVDGRGVVALTGRSSTGPVSLEALEMEIPNLRFPFDLSGGAATFRHRRCRLRHCTLVFSEKETLRWLGTRVGQAAYGYRGLRLQLGPGAVEVTGQVAFGEQAADFVMRGMVLPDEGRRVRVCFCDLRLFGVFPIPAPLLAAGLLRAVGATADVTGEARLIGCADVLIDPLSTTLLRTLPLSGWRLPSLASVLLSRVQLEPGKLTLDYSGERPQTAERLALTARLRRFAAAQEAKGLFAAAEAAVLAASPADAVQAYRQHLAAHPRHPFIVERLLQLLCSEVSAEEETLQLVHESRATDPEFIPALLAEAAVRSRRGELTAAAECYRRVADISAREHERADETAAALAAGCCWLAVDRQQARRDFERALELDADNETALGSLAPLYAEAGDWQRLVQIRQRQIALAGTHEKRLHGHIALGELQRVHLADPPRARDQYQRALEIDPQCEPALRGLAEACIDADELVNAVRALDRLCQLVADRQDADAEVAVHLRIASLWEHLGDRPNALARLQRALTLRPDDPQSLQRTAALMIVMDRRGEAIDLLEHLAAALKDAAARVEVHGQLAEHYLTAGDPKQAQLHLAAAMALDSSQPAILHLAVSVAERTGDNDALAVALGRAAAAATDAAARSELLLRRGRLLAEQGRDDDAVAALRQAADDDTDGGWAAQIELAMFFDRRRSWSEARDAWARVVETNAGRSDAHSWYQLGLVCQRLGEAQPCRAALERAIALSSDKIDLRRAALTVLVQVTQVLKDDAAHVQALEEYLPLLDPIVDADERVHLLIDLGESYRAQGALDRAAEALAQAVALAPAHLALLESFGRLQQDLQQWELARSALEPVLSGLESDPTLAPRRAAVAMRLGAIGEAQGRVREAIEFYRRALEEGLDLDAAEHCWDRIIELHLDRNDATAAARAAMAAAAAAAEKARKAERLFTAGQIWIKRVGQPELAVECFREALRHAPRHANVLDALESICTEQRDREALVEILQLKVEAATRRPAVQRALLARLGEVLAELGRRDEARTAYSGALSLDGDYLPALLYLGREAMQLEDLDRAEIYLRRLATSLSRPDADPPVEDPARLLVDVHLQLADLARRRRRPQEEEGHLELALAADPRHAVALERLDQLLAPQERNAEVVEVLRRRAEIATDAEMAAALELRRAALLEALPGRSGDAAAACRQALLLRPGLAPALEQLARILRGTRNSGELLEVLEELAELVEASGDKAAAKRLWSEAAEVAQVRLSTPARAVGHLRRAVRCAPDDPRLLDGLLALLGDEPGEEANDLISRRAALEGDPTRRCELDLRLALRLERAGETARALQILALACEEQRASTAALEATARLYEVARAWREAAAIYEELCRRAREAGDGAAELVATRRLLLLTSQHLGNPSALEGLCRRVLELDGSDREALASLADRYQEREDWPALVDVLQRLLTAARRNYPSADEEFRLISRQALALDRAGRPIDSAVLEEAMKLALQEHRLLWPLAGLARDLELEPVELRCLTVLADETPVDPELHVRIADLHRHAGDRSAASQALLVALHGLPAGAVRTRAARDLLQLVEGSTDATGVRADAMDTQSALIALQILRHEDPQPSEQLRLAQLLADDPVLQVEALGVLRELPAPEQERAEVRVLRWRLLREQGQLPVLAEEQERWARQLEPAERVEACLAVARLWGEQLRNLERAGDCALAAALAQPPSLALLDRVARLLGELGAWDGLLLIIERMAAPDGVAPRGLQAELLCSGARHRRAAGRPWTEIERAYRQALERDPRCLEALDGLAEVYGDLSADEQLAVILVQRSECGAEVAPRVQALLRAVNVLAQRLHRPQEALPLLQRALELRPEDHQVLRGAADLYQLTGDLAQAEEALVALAELGSDPEDSLNRACGLARRRGDAPAEALYLSHLARLHPEGRTSLRLVRAYRAAGDLRGLNAVLEQLSQQDPEALIELARLQAGPLENPIAAHDALRRYLERHPDHCETHEAMVELCDRLGKREEALIHLRRLRDVADGDRRPHLDAKLARREEELGLLDRAEQSWRAALTESSSDPVLILGLAENLRRQQRWGALCVHLEECLTATGERLDAESRSRLATLLGEVYIDQTGDAQAGIRWLSSACSLAANDAAYRRLLSLYRQRQDFLEAAELIAQRIRQLAGSDRSHLWRELGYIQEIHLKDLAMAASSYAVAYRESPQADPRVASAAVDLYRRADETDPALALLEEMLARAEESARAPLLATRARVLVAKGQIPAAIEEYEHALRRDPQLYGAHAELGQQLFSRGQFSAALPHLLSAAEHIDDAREAAHCAFLAGRTLEKLGLVAEAVARYELAIARDPTNRASHEALLPTYQTHGLWEKLAASLTALGSLTIAAASRAPLLARLAEVELRLGRTEAAVASYDRALELDPQLVDALTGARQLAQARQDWPRCVELLERELALSADPRAKARLHRQLGQLFDGPTDDVERAVRHYTAALELDEHDDDTALLLLPLLERSLRFEHAGRLSERIAGRTTERAERRTLLLRAAGHLQRAGLHGDSARLEREAVALADSAPPAAAQPETVARSEVGDLAMTDDWQAMMDGYRARAASHTEPHERAELLLLLARNLEDKFSRPLEALAIYSEACAVAHDYLPAVEGYADAAYRNQDWHLARDLYDRLWNESPVQLRSEVFYRRALVYETLGDETTADSCYAQTIALDPTHRTALEGRARLALYRDDVPVAIETLSLLVRLISVDEVEALADMREQLGKLHKRIGDLHAAQQYLENALALDSHRTKTMQSLLGVYESQGNFAGMVNLLLQLTCLTPDPLIRASLLHHRAEILGARLGDEEAAVDDLLKAYDLAPEYPPTLWRLVDYYWEQGDLESVAEMGVHLHSAMALEEKSPDQRHVRLAAAMLYGADRERARPLLEVALSNPLLLEPALLDLGRIVAGGGPTDPLVALIHSADPAGALLRAGTLLLEHSAPPGVAELIAALRRISAG